MISYLERGKCKESYNLPTLQSAEEVTATRKGAMLWWTVAVPLLNTKI